jgi:hypothetical protein
MLSKQLLEENPNEYYRQICELNQNNINISEILNSTEYNSWFGTDLHCLFYLVGDLQPKYDKDGNECVFFYGYGHSISNELGIKILKELITGGVDINIKDYYQETVQDKLNTPGLTTRINNTNFIKEIEKLYQN